MSVISIKNGDAFTSSQDEVGVIAGDYATQSYVNTAISDLIDGAPTTLDTLNELAAALQDDANFASTVVLKAGSTMTGDLILNADPTNALGAATKQYVDNTIGGSAINLDDLADVTSGTPSGVRHVLWYEGIGATPKWSSQELNLNDSMFANLAITSLADKDILKYDSSTSKWINSDTFKGIKNVADNYSEIAAFESNTTVASTSVGIELQRNLSTDGAVSGRDTRGVAQLYAVYSDSGNTNGSATAIYPGGFTGQSGSNDGTSPHWLKAFTYDDGISSFNEETIWEGTKDEFNIYPQTKISNLLEVEGTSGGVETSVVNIKTDNSGWDKGQITLEDSNAKAVTITGEDNTSLNKFRYIQTFDPDGDHNPSGGGTGDYGMYYYKDYSNLSTGVIMGWDVFGAQDRFEWRVRGDNNGGTDSYDYKPIKILSDTFTLQSRDGYASVTNTLEVSSTKVEAKVPVQLPVYADNTARDAAITSPAAGMTILNGTTFQGYDGSSWVDLN